MEKAMTDGLMESTKIVQERLGLSTKLILIGLTEVSPIECREISMGMEGCQNETALRMEDAMPFP